MTNSEKLKLLNKRQWSINDISKYFEIPYNKANEFRIAAQKNGCGDFFETYAVNVSKFLNYAGTSIEEEKARLKSSIEIERFLNGK